MRLAIFDLDNTLLAGDSDHLWGDYLVEHGHVDPQTYKQTNDRFYGQYTAGTLDIHEYTRFSTEPLIRLSDEKLRALRKEFVAQCIDPIIAPAAPALLERHRIQGDTVIIITATNSFVTEPIAELLDVDDLLATDLERENGNFTGRIKGTPCFREGKCERLDQWLAAQSEKYSELTFYSDSHNDLPLLERVQHPVAVDPDPQLASAARERNWPVISLREPLAALSEDG